MATYRDLGYNSFLIRSIKSSLLDPDSASVVEGADNYTDLGFDYTLNHRELDLPRFSPMEVKNLLPPDSVSFASLSADKGTNQFWKWITDEAPTSGASDTGWVVPTAFTDSNSVWTNEGNAYASDNNYAIATAVTGTAIKYLYYYTFDFSAIGDTATINGVEVLVECHWANKTPYPGVKSLAIGQGTTYGSNNAQRRYECQNYPITADSQITVGGNGDLWGLGLTPAYVKDSTFGVLFGVTSGLTSSTDWNLDYIAMKIYYTA